MAKQAKPPKSQSTATKKKDIKKAAPKRIAKTVETPVWAKETRYPAKFLR